MNTNKKMKTLLVTSTFPGEGKSWVTSNLAVTFAQAGKKVVLIDADMRKGRQYSIFGISPRPGLSNYLSQVEIDENENPSEEIIDYIQETEVENLYLMPAGNIPPNPSELLVSAQMIKLLDELRELCDLIIIDGTPCELVTDSIILSRLVDSTIIVTAHKSTKKDTLERIVKNIQNVGGKIAGVVINKVPISNKKYGETYYYYGESSLHTNKNKKKKDQIKRTEFKKANNFNSQRVVETITKDREKQSEDIKSQIKNEKIEKLDNNITVETKEPISMEKTNDILKQINEYLDQEKKNLNKQ
jgi:capsular exopolysaccharide synthesis family protein